jgi:hypothetical protein
MPAATPKPRSDDHDFCYRAVILIAAVLLVCSAAIF